MTTASPASVPPALRLSQMVCSLWVPQAVHAAAELGLGDVLAPGPLPAEAVAQRLGTHPDATGRLLGALATLGVLHRSGDGFGLTEVGQCLRSGAPATRRAWARLMGAPPVWQAWGRLVEAVRTGGKTYGSGPDADTFDAVGTDPEGAAVFHQAMADGTHNAAPALARALDLRGVRSLADVGGGYGALLCGILEAAPEAEGFVFDLPHARDGALALFAARGLAGRARFVAGSFFEETPPPADLYVVKSVIHDWDDARSLQILARCRDAMGEKARLALIEAPAGAPAPDPVTEWFLAFSDLNMLVNTGGRERNAAAYTELMERAGLRVTSVTATGTMYSVFESVRG